MNPAPPVSVVIPVRNEEANISRCLAALEGFDEIFVVDSASTDRTREIVGEFARESGRARLVDFSWDGGFPKKRNWALRNLTFAHPWVLFLDADECVSEGFARELAATLPQTPHAGFRLTYHNYFMDRLMKHGDPFRKLALIRLGAGEYERIDDERWSTLDMEVHEHPILEGTVGLIRAPVVHRDYKGLDAWLARHNDYSSWEARRYLALREGRDGRTDEDAWAKLTPRQRLKYRLVDTWFFGSAYGFASYFLKLGFLDGLPGFILAILKIHYFFQIKCKITEARMKR